QPLGHLRLTAGPSVAVITGGGGFSMLSGNKNRAVNTDYGIACIASYETPEPSFADYGSGILDQNGECYVFIDPIFMQTVSPECGYQVFLQKYGSGDIWVKERFIDHFVIQGTANLSFGWNIVLHQKGYEMDRAEMLDVPIDPYTDTLTKEAIGNQTDYEQEAHQYLKTIEETYYNV
ncbi:MAG: hypothetical protein RR614_03115, partial [Eubacterium sp.]